MVGFQPGDTISPFSLRASPGVNFRDDLLAFATEVAARIPGVIQVGGMRAKMNAMSPMDSSLVERFQERLKLKPSDFASL